MKQEIKKIITLQFQANGNFRDRNTPKCQKRSKRESAPIDSQCKISKCSHQINVFVALNKKRVEPRQLYLLANISHSTLSSKYGHFWLQIQLWRCGSANKQVSKLRVHKAVGNITVATPSFIVCVVSTGMDRSRLCSQIDGTVLPSKQTTVVILQNLQSTRSV